MRLVIALARFLAGLALHLSLAVLVGAFGILGLALLLWLPGWVVPGYVALALAVACTRWGREKWEEKREKQKKGR